MVKVGLLGAGFMGKTHAQAYGALPDAQLVAVADMSEENAKELAASEGATYYREAKDLIDQAEVDLIDICLPTYLHSQFAIQAAERGRNVFCEKPMARTLEEAQAMIEAAEKAQVKMMVGQCIRFWPEYKVLKDYVDSQKLGKLTSLQLTRLSPPPRWAYQNWLLTEDKSGSAALDLHIHDTDWVLYLLGRPQSVHSAGSRDQSGLAHIYTTYHYPEVAVSAEGGWDFPDEFPFQMAYRAMFERGVLVFDTGADPTLLAYEAGKEPVQPEVEKPDIEATERGGNIAELGGYFLEIQYFVNCIANDQMPEVVTPRDAMAAMEVVFAEIESVETGKTVELPTK